MENVISRTFESPLTLDQMLERLSAGVLGVEWGIRESEYDDRYIKGMTSQGVKIRILKEDPRFSVEVYFPLSEDARSLLSTADKLDFLKRLDGHVLAAVKAENVKDD